MKPTLETLKAALARVDDPQIWGAAHDQAREELRRAATAAGFTHSRAIEDWARYQVAVGEAADQMTAAEEPEPETRELFG